MLTRRCLVLGAGCAALVSAALASAALAGPARADDASPLALVVSIYSAYGGKDAKGVPLDDERTIRRYFEPVLATAMAKDQKTAARRGDVGKLDFDPFLEAQDWEVDTFDYETGGQVGGKPQVINKFENEGEAMTVLLDMVRVKTDWRIYDITWKHDGKTETLRKIFIR
jgi:hypothetical protein